MIRRSVAKAMTKRELSPKASNRPRKMFRPASGPRKPAVKPGGLQETASFDISLLLGKETVDKMLALKPAKEWRKSAEEAFGFGQSGKDVELTIQSLSAHGQLGPSPVQAVADQQKPSRRRSRSTECRRSAKQNRRRTLRSARRTSDSSHRTARAGRSALSRRLAINTRAQSRQAGRRTCRRAAREDSAAQRSPSKARKSCSMSILWQMLRLSSEP